MFSYSSHIAQIKKYPIAFLLVPFFLVATSFKPVFNIDNPKTTSIHRASLKESGNNSTAFYVPRIGLVKQGVLNPGGAGIQPCTTIDYTYYITNESTNGESFEAIVLNDPSVGINNINLNNNIGDSDNDDFLDDGEEWIYTISYNITSEERVAGEVIAEQATVNASSDIGNIFDSSHPNDPLANGDETIDIHECQPRVSLLKTGFLDPAGFVPCTTIGYSFLVTNESLGPEEFQNIQLDDPILGPGSINGPTFDSGGDGKLSPGETWEFTALYTIQQDDLQLGEVQNQAEVDVEIDATGDIITDFSHPTDTSQDDFTIIDIVSCQNPVVEMLLTAAQPVDTDSDTCPDAIDYIYIVRNSGNVDVNVTSLIDNLDNVISLPNPNNGDADNDNQLDIVEEWVYTARYDIDQTDIDNSPLDNQATLLATIVGSGTPVPAELSHETDFTSAGLTSVDISGTCADTAAIGITKEADINGLIDTDADGCPDAIQYTIRVSNEGNVNLTTVIVNDTQLGNDIPGPSSGDDGNGILEPNEIWVYLGNYDIREQDINNNNGDVTGQADVSAVPAVGVQISDLSHSTLFDDDADTVTNVTGTCFDTVAIGLTKIETDIIDSNPINGCDDQIEYTITIHNLGGMDLNITNLDDNQLGDITAGPFTESINVDGVLQIGEVWEYVGVHNITVQEAADGNVTGRANVTAQPVGTAVSIMDESHPTDETDVGDTVVPIPGACADGPSIAVIRELQMEDTDMDGCNDQINFTITVYNTGGLDLINIVLTDDQLPSPVVGPDIESINTNGILEVGEEWSYTGSYNISQTDIDGGDIFSGATVEAESAVGNIPVQDSSHPLDPTNNADNEILFSGTCDDTVGISIIRNTTLEDSGDGDNCMDRIAITIDVINSGNAPLDNVVVNDDLLINPPALSSNGNGDTILDSGESWTYTANYDLDQADIDGINVISGADVRAQHIGSTFQVVDDSHPTSPILDEDNNDDVSGACADIAAITLVRTPILSGTDVDNCPNVIDFSFTVTNSGQVNLNAVELIDDNLSSPVMGPDDESINTNGILEVNEVWTYTGSYDFSQDDIDNTPLISGAIVTAEPIGSSFQVSDSDQNNIDLAGACDTQSVPAIGLIKQFSGFNSDSEGCLESIAYSYSLRNLGNEDISNIAISDAMLGATNLAIASGDIGTPNVLEVGETWVFESFVYFVASGDITTGEVVTQATVTGASSDSATQVLDESDDNSYVENEITRTSVIDACPPTDLANIGLIKTASLFDSDGDLCSDSIIYFFTVENLGNIALENIRLDDIFLGITLAQPNNRGSNEDEILDVGEQWNYTLVRPITQEDIDRTFIENQAMVTAYRTDMSNNFITDLSDENFYASETPTNISVIGACVNTSAGIGLVKTGTLLDSNNDGCLESIQYTYRVANLGNQPLTGLILRDDLFENPIDGPLLGDVNDNETLDTTEEWTYTAAYGITQEDLNLGFVENQATVSASIVGQENFIVNDISDSDLFTRDNLTRVSVIEACFGGTISDPNFKIFTGITPNGDGINDFFRIRGIENFPNNSLKIYNRWGVLVYEANQYGEGSNLFSGTSFGRATVAEDRSLPTGTYFYILTFSSDNPGKESYSGYLYINRD